MKRLAVLILLAAAGWAQTATPRFGRGVWRGQDVEFRVLDGWAVYQGDILIGRADEMEARYRAMLEAPTAVAKGNLRQAIAVADATHYWPNATIPYEIDPAFGETSNIDYAVRYWNEHTVIKLVPRQGEANYVRFTVYSDPSVCASSALGMSGNGRQVIYGSETCPGPVLVHEIGHAVGLDHEQSRSDRDRYVTVLWENISKFNRNQFAAFLNEIDVGPYDYDSIMHYGVPDFGKSGPAMQTIPPGIPIRQGKDLSSGDVDAVARIYGSPPAEVTLATTPSGLKLLVDGEEIVAPRKFAWAKGSIHRVEAPEVQNDADGRYVFARWSGGQARSDEITADAARVSVYNAAYVRYNRYRFEVSPPGAGTVTVQPESADGYYRDGVDIRITATPAPRYAFRNWSGPYAALNNLKNFAPNPWGAFAHAKYQGLTANFTPVSGAPLTTVRFDTATEAGADVGGTVRVDGVQYRSPAAFGWEPGSTHKVEVDAQFPDSVDQKLVEFQKWSDGAERSRQVTASDQPASYTAVYGNKFGFEAYGNTGGGLSITPFNADLYYPEGTTVQLRARPDPGSNFLAWSRDLSGTQNPLPLVMNATTSTFVFFGPANSASRMGVMDAARQRVNTSISSRGFSVPAVSPGEVIVINAPDIAADVEAVAAPEGQNFPTVLAGVRVLIDSVPAPVLAVNKGQVTAVVPYAAGGSRAVTVQLEYNEARTAPDVLAIAPSVPSIYTADGSGAGAARALNEDGAPNSPDSPAARGSVVTFFATGLGAPDSEVQDGQVFDILGPAPRGRIALRIGSEPAEIVSTGLAPGQPGVYRIQARIGPAARPGKAAPLFLTLDGEPSQYDVTLTVR